MPSRIVTALPMGAIVYGAYRKETPEGFVADFCPLCREIKSFALMGVRSASHIYFVSLTKGKLVGHVIRCTECHASQIVEKERYAHVSEKQFPDLEVLTAMTNPNLRAELGDRLALEQTLKACPASIPAAQREALVLEPFVELDPEVELSDKGILHSRSSYTSALLITMVTVGVGVGLTHGRDESSNWVGGCGAAAWVCTWLTVRLTGEAKFMRRHILPNLARALHPIKPALEEIRSALTKCRADGLSVGKKIKAERLWGELQKLSNAA